MRAEPDTGIELRAGRLRLAVRPDLGGCIAGLWHEGAAVLLSAEPATLKASRPSASFPLAPYSNRIGQRRFRWEGEVHTTAENFAGSPHSLHGVAWLRPWAVVSARPQALSLRYVHSPDAHWPFAFSVEQHFELAPSTLTVRLSLSNTDRRAQPVGLGWHPYFPKRSRSHLQAGVAARWETDAYQLPTQRVAHPAIDDDIDRLRLDHCFDAWDGHARIRDEALSVALRSSLQRLVVYTPADKNYFCVEPVSHVNNAIQMDDPVSHGIVALAPGRTTDAWMALDIDAP